MSSTRPSNFDPLEDSAYQYIPSKSVAIIMIVLFSISTLLHSGQAVYHKTWWIFPTVILCGIGEIIGWSGRLWSHSEPWNDVPFQIQITCTIIAPTPLLAATFIVFGQLIRRLGSVYSRISPRLYTILFCSCDVLSLVIQAIGGGMAASADQEKGESAEGGGNVMLGGIALQLFAIVAFSACALEFTYRYFADKPLHVAEPASLVQAEKNQKTGRGILTTKLKTVLGAVLFSTIVLFIRAIYRTVELTDGWNGRIIGTELYFNVLDGAMIILAIYTLNFIHPGIFLSEPLSNTGLYEKTPMSSVGTISR